MLDEQDKDAVIEELRRRALPITGVDARISSRDLTSSGRTADTDGATITMNWAEKNVHSVTLGANRIIAWKNVKDGQVLVVILRQDGTGSRTVTWPGTVAWSGGTAPTLTTAINKTDIFVFVRHDTDVKEYGAVVGLNY